LVARRKSGWEDRAASISFSISRSEAAFSRVFTANTEEGTCLRKAHAVAKATTVFVGSGAGTVDAFDVTPVMVGGADARDLSDESEAIAQLKQCGARKWPSASKLEQFERALLAPENRALAARAHRRPVAPAGGAYPFPR